MLERPIIIDENAVELVNGITMEYPYTMHERILDEDMLPWHCHTEVEFGRVLEGTMIIETLNQIYTVKEGEAYFTNSNVMNTKRRAPNCRLAHDNAHLFHPILLTGHYHSVYETKYLNPILQNQTIEVVVIRNHTPSGKRFLRILNALYKLYGEPDQEFKVRYLLGLGWQTLMEEFGTKEQKVSISAAYTNERIKSMVNFLNKNYDQKITLSDLARHVGLGEKECIRSFKTALNQTPIDYLMNYRIERARLLLTETEESILNIALETGFQSSAYFGKIFKRKTGMTPKEYRLRQKS